MSTSGAAESPRRPIELSILAMVLASTLVVSPAAHAEHVHVVQPGESLWSIAERVQGDASLWPALFRANRDQIGHPGVLHPGQRLLIPALEVDADGVRRDDDPQTR